MSNQESDPCHGCRHLRTYTCPCQRPTCARKALFGDERCRKEPAPVAPQRIGGRRG